MKDVRAAVTSDAMDAIEDVEKLVTALPSSPFSCFSQATPALAKSTGPPLYKRYHWLLFLSKRGPSFSFKHPSCAAFCDLQSNLPPPSSPLMLPGVYGARPKGPMVSGRSGLSPRVLLPSLPHSVLSVRQVGRTVAHFADKVKSSPEEGGWLGGAAKVCLTHRGSRLLGLSCPFYRTED